MQVITLVFLASFGLGAQSFQYTAGIECQRFEDCLDRLPKGKVAASVVYLADIADYDAMNRVYQTYFPALKPARNTVQAPLSPGMRMAIQATLYTGPDDLRGLTPPNVTNVVPITPGVFAGNRLFIAGILGRDSNSGTIPESPAAQVEMCLTRLANIFRSAKLSPSNTLQITAYHTARVPRETLTAALERFFGPAPTAAFTILEVPALALGAQVAINGIAIQEK